jgi:hypothetical protein
MLPHPTFNQYPHTCQGWVLVPRQCRRGPEQLGEGVRECRWRETGWHILMQLASSFGKL